ncbi:TreTu family toxin [Crossiella sp. CA198]|uniref:TreTu family toxin n=1 Tax=Crossiella sp. CA198 TaxID=3455607 RepID=UPI003F8D5F08
MKVRMFWRAVALTAAMSLATTSAAAIAAPATTAFKPREVQKEKSVPGKPVPVDPAPAAAESVRKAIATPPKVNWPGRGNAEVELPAAATAPQGRSARPEQSTVEHRRAGSLPVAVGLVPQQASARSAPGEPGKARVEFFDQALAAKAGVAGVLLKVSDAGGLAGRGVSVQLDYREFAEAFGANYGSRLRLMQYPECVLTTPDRPECRTGTPLRGENHAKDRQLTAAVELAEPSSPGRAAVGSTAVLAAAPAPGSNGGSYQASDLAPASSWSAGRSSGDFSYSLPVKLPPSLGGPAPSVALAYSSGSADGRTSATNNQASVVGDGWDLSAGGYVERKYRPCQEDKDKNGVKGNQGDRKVGDQCYDTDNATLMLGGTSGELVRDTANNRWRPKKDDGSYVELVKGADNGDNDGEYWKVTTTDGTQYFLGRNKLPGNGNRATHSTWTTPVYGNHPDEPCYRADFGAAWCQQAWRWNLDQVIDTRGNTTVYYYNIEENHYGRNISPDAGTYYVRAGNIDRIEYGLRADNPVAKAPMQVRFETAERCLPAGAITCEPGQLNKDTAKSWPDVPFDQICAANAKCDNQFSPTFFTRKRLTRVVTELLREVPGAEPRHFPVESWNLRHSFPESGDGLSPALWLAGATRTGHVGGTASLPEITFGGTSMVNRVGTVDRLASVTRYRLTGIGNEGGGHTTVKYKDHECVKGAPLPAPEANTLRCYPTWWSPEGAPEPLLDWFHKYVVEQVIESDRIGGSSLVKTRYEYPAKGGAWHFDDNEFGKPEHRTYSGWRGFGTVTTIKGEEGTTQSVSESRYLRGMDGDRMPGGGKRPVLVKDSEGTEVRDHDSLQGFVLENLDYDGGGKVLSASVNQPWLSEPTATHGEDKSVIVQTGEVRGRTRLADGTWRRTKVAKTYDPKYGLPLTVDDAGDTAVTGDEKCTQNSYQQNTDRWLLGLSSRVLTIAAPCAALPGKDADRISDVRSGYDHQEAGKAPLVGEVTSVERWNGAGYQIVSRTKYDEYGRTTETTDAGGQQNTISYSPARGMAVNTITSLNPLQHKAIKTIEPAWASPVAEIGVNGERADLAYDALGRLTKVWPPHYPKVNDSTPASTEYAYEYRPDKPATISTKSLQENGKYTTSIKLLDGLLRERQTQTPALGGGRVLTDTWYDSRGLAAKVNGGYYNVDSGPVPELLGVLDNSVPNQTITEHDALARPTEVIQRKGDGTNQAEQKRTSSRYEGDRTHVIPPTGDTVTTVIKDAQGQITERRQYHGLVPDGAHDVTTYSYTKSGQLAGVKDPMGNTWRYEYDALGRKLADHDPDRGSTTFRYNALDQLTSTTDARGKTLAYTYDPMGRKDGMYEDAPTGKKLAEWTFDTLKKGLPTASTRFVDGVPYTSRVDAYDGANRPTKTSVVIPAQEGALGRTYSFQARYYPVTGALSQTTMPGAGGLSAENVNYEYNQLGLPEKTYGIQTYAQQHKYTEFGESSTFFLGEAPNLAQITTNYEPGSRRISSMILDRDASPNREVNYRHLSYDKAGNITRIADKPEGGPQDVQCFRYDYLRRMTTAFTPNTDNCAVELKQQNIGGAAAYWYGFTFDQAGNRKTEVKHTPQGDTTRTYQYPAPGGPAGSQPHTVRSIEQSGPGGTRKDEFGYNATGDTTTRKVTGFEQKLDWNTEGKLTKVTEADGKESTYLYDTAGNRLLKKENGSTTLYLPGMELTMPKDGQPTAKRYYTHGGATIAVRGTVSGLNYLAADHQGSPTTTINAGNLDVSRRYQDPFGQSRGQTSASWPDDKGLVGGVNDGTGLTHIGAREYDNTTGRFVSVDPVMDLTDPQQIHGYSYANGSPVTFADPTGLAPDCRPHCYEGGENYNRVTPPGVSRADRVRDENARIARSQARIKAEQKARERAGVSDDEYREAKRLARMRVIDVVLEVAGDVLKDVIGLTDMEDCFVKGEVGGCVSMALNLIPAAKIFSTLGKIISGIARAIDAVATWLDKVRPAKALLAKVDSIADDLKANGGSCPRQSFVPGTRVLLADGSSKPVEEVKIGDQVQAADPEKGESGSRKVVGTVTSESVKRLVTVTVDTDGDRGEVTGSVVATANHPFWVDNQGRWVHAGELKSGDQVLDAAGSRVSVVATSERVAIQRVHNLTVDGIHTYYVSAGTSSVLAHNCGPDGEEELTRVGRWMSEVEMNKMMDSGLVQEGAGGRTFVVKSLNPDDYKATAKGSVYVEFNVPKASVHNGSKPEWGVIPGPNIPTKRFGAPPDSMPPATCIKLVCRK